MRAGLYMYIYTELFNINNPLYILRSLFLSPVVLYIAPQLDYLFPNELSRHTSPGAAESEEQGRAFRFAGDFSLAPVSSARVGVSQRGIPTIWLARLPERDDGRLFDGPPFSPRVRKLRLASCGARPALSIMRADGVPCDVCATAYSATVMSHLQESSACETAVATASPPASFAFACVPRVCSGRTRQDSGAFCGCTRRVNTRVNSREKRRNCWRARLRRPRLPATR